MIIKTVPNSTPQIEIGQAVSQDVVIKTIPTAPLDDFCLCSIGMNLCEYEELAFWGGADDFENDFKSFFINKVDVSDVIEFSFTDLDTNDEVILDANNAADYGFYSEDETHVGIHIDIPTLHTMYPTLTRMIVNWKQDVFGTIVESKSHVFAIAKFDVMVADGTVKLETTNNGRIESGNDYNDLNWKRSMRIKGKFGYSGFPLTTDEYLDGNRVYEQIIDSIETEYELETELVPASIYKMIVFNDMLANGVSVSDFNIMNANYKGVKVKPTGIDFQTYAKNPNGSFVFTFTDRVQNNRKRNV